VTRTPSVIGWRLEPADRDRLLSRIAPRYAHVVADHVTLKDAGDDERAPPVGDAVVVGEADDGHGVQALVVSLNGTTHRPGGGAYHLTWSLSPGRQAGESNAVIAEHGWTVLDPLPIELIPARF
jgi:hypothetical protein